MNWLIASGICSFVAAILHLAIIVGGANWYRFFGAGEAMAKMAENGSWYPSVVTLAIASLLALWGAYAFSAAKLLPLLPLLKPALIVITSIYLLRALAGLVLATLTQHPLNQAEGPLFWWVSSIICLVIGLLHLAGLIVNWRVLSS